jgi:uncharacterized protein (TIGR02600 family)
LVVVLAFLVLAAIVVIGFLGRATSLRKATAHQRAAAGGRVLADTVVNLVQGQIDHAATAGAGTAWASQPGAVRLFDSSGNLQRIYRLYSAPSVTAAAAGDLQGDIPPADWATSPWEWVDLNAPVSFRNAAGGSVTRFPILDPRDPADLTKFNPVEGFALSATPGAPLAESGAPGATALQPSPMPVRWMYVLRDGTIAAGTPDAEAGGMAVTGASAANPITGRIAFWTDDETCRVNINTAAGAAFMGNGAPPTFWDTPRFNAPDERNFGLFSPASKEFQRYPGHPATTTLSKVFPTLTSPQLLSLAPRYEFGGSEDATRIASAAVPPKTDRLYSSVGELLYAQNRNVNRTPTGGAGSSNFSLSAEQLESARFFLTAHSRSPETTLFGTPRVSMWPVHSNPANRTATDGLLAFASRVNNMDYHFQRSIPGSGTADITLPRNLQLLNYLDSATSRPVPGFGGSFATKYGVDRRDILVKSFDYIRSTNLADPSLAAANRYAASGVVVPTRHPTWNANGQPLQGLGRFPVINEVSLWFVAHGRGPTPPGTTGVPIHPLQTGIRSKKGNAAYWLPASPGVAADSVPAANRMAVQAYFVFGIFDPGQGWGAITGGNILVRVRGLNGLSVRAGTETFPLNMPPEAAVRNWLGTPGSPTGNPAGLYGGRSWGGNRGFREFILMYGPGGIVPGRTCVPLGPNANGSLRTYPFYSEILSLPVGNMELLSSAQPVVVEVYADPAAGFTASNLVSTYEIDLSQLANIPTPVPALADDTTNSFGLPTGVPNKGIPGARDRAAMIAWEYQKADIRESIRQDDVFWSMVPSGPGVAGDYRLLANTLNSASRFVAHSSVASGNRLAFTMKWDGGRFPGETASGKLVQGASYPAYPLRFPLPVGVNNPSIPSGIDGVTAANDGTTPGDWDNGFSFVPDGPYINKADEGNAQGLGTVSSPYFDGTIHTFVPIIPGLFSPNRMIPSAGMLGSLPSGSVSGRPWQTLLFRPGPTGHIGATSPRDHLFLDLFWMPVAEPYAISEPFSTDGKVNLNYQIQPFNYIKRNTALRSVLASEAVARVPRGEANRYKLDDSQQTTKSGLPTNARLPISLDESHGALRQFEQRFAAGDVFRSGTEICDIFLPPAGTQWNSDANARTGWYGDDFAMVGDNVRERPYANLLGRVTTKSNTFTVHYTVQSLKVPSQQPQDVWVEGKGAVLSEYRGSTSLERYLDPNDNRIPDYATDPGAPSLDRFYNWRILENRQFAP